MVLKSNSGSFPETIEKLHVRAEQKYSVLWDNYLASKHITTTLDSHSLLRICGISDTHFWYKLGIRLEGDGYFMLSQRLKSFKGSDADNDLENKLRCYKKIEESQVQFCGESIALSNIQYFKVEGSEQYVSEVSGGGVNLRGAVAGGLLGGGAAAVIGSQLGTETKTEVVKKDDRKVVIVYSENDELKVLNTDSSDIEATVRALRKLIPQKEESVFLNKQTVKGDSNTNIDDIKKFKELLDSEIITQEEFDTKKKQLLGL